MIKHLFKYKCVSQQFLFRVSYLKIYTPAIRPSILANFKFLGYSEVSYPFKTGRFLPQNK